MVDQDVDRQAQIRLRHFMETYNAMVNVDGHRAAVPTFVAREMARLQTAEQRLRAALEKARHDLDGNANAKPKDFLNTPVSDEPYTFIEPVVLGDSSPFDSELFRAAIEQIRKATQSRAQAQIDLRWCINCEEWSHRESAQAPLVCPTCSHETTSYAALKRAVVEFETAAQATET